MTATTTPYAAGLPPAPALGATGGAGIPMSRLVRVELRKLVDTRAAAWLLVAIAAVTVGVVTVYLLASDSADLTFADFVNVTMLPQSLLLPVLGIMAVTSEWTQRTGLVTHTLEPRRNRVIMAKSAATGVLGVLAVGLALAAAALANVLASTLMEGNGSWSYGLAGLRDTVLLQALSLAQGLALGMLTMNTAAAIVLSFVLPSGFMVVFSMVASLKSVAGWIDLATSQQPLVDHNISGVLWLHLLATTVGWIVLPWAAGMWRLLRREIK
jgi:ABC-type transport system involved in multi-copper enzyme maturation permease subunit